MALALDLDVGIGIDVGVDIGVWTSTGDDVGIRISDRIHIRARLSLRPRPRPRLNPDYDIVCLVQTRLDQTTRLHLALDFRSTSENLGPNLDRGVDKDFGLGLDLDIG